MILHIEETEISNRINCLKPEINKEYCNMDDASEGRLYAEIFKDTARFNVTAKNWFIYNGIVWEEDVGGVTVAKYAEILSTCLYVYSADKDTTFKNNVSKLGNLSTRKRMLEDASKHYAVKQTDFDSYPNFLNVRNGILDLDNMKLLPHDSNFLLTKCCNCSYYNDATSDDFNKFINEIMCGDKDKIRYLQKISGLGITCSSKEEECYIYYGEKQETEKVHSSKP